MTYEETTELEKNVEIKNEADKLYEDFKKYVTLDAGTFFNGRFTIWKDSNNATYLAVSGNTLIFQCRFLHETYNIVITPSGLFDCIKSKYRGMAHFRGVVSEAKEKSNRKSNP
jgi:hypothetical protein